MNLRGTLGIATSFASVILVGTACVGESQPPKPVSNSVEELSTSLDLDLYTRMAPARIWGSPYVPAISMALVVDDNQARIAQMSKGIERYIKKYWSKDPASLTLRKLGYLMPAVESAAQNPEGYQYPIVPVLIIPSEDASMSTLRALFDAGAGQYFPGSYVLVAWNNAGSRVATADIWLSLSTEPNAYMIQDEFYDKAWMADHSILIMGPTRAIECRAPREGLGPCELQTGRTKLTRIGLCGFDTWGQALAAMETRVSRVTEVALFRDCSFLERKVSELTSESTLE